MNLNTKDAFNKIINDPEIYSALKTNAEKTKFRQMRIRGAKPETMEHIIESHGGIRVQETLWKL